MNFNEYQEEAAKTAIYPNDELLPMYPYLGLAEESGELLGKVAKIIRDEEGIPSDDNYRELEKELGDVLWNLSAIATDLGVSLDRVASINLEKLKSRADRNKLSGSGDNR